MKPATRTVLYSQLIFYIGLVVAVLVRPAGLETNDGISYYGIYRSTFFPYAVGLLGAAYFAARAADQLGAKEFTWIRLALRVYAPLVVGLVITPYAASKWMDYLHTICGSALFSLQLILSGWLVWRLKYVWWSVALTALEFATGILCAIYLAPRHGLLLQYQTLFQLAFGALLILALQKLIPDKLPHK